MAKYLKGYQLGNDEVSLSIADVRANPREMVATGNMTVKSSGSFKLDVGFDLTVPLKKSGSISFKTNADLKSLMSSVAGTILEAMNIPDLTGGWVQAAGIYDPDGDQIPNGLWVDGNADLFGSVQLSIPRIAISNEGMHFIGGNGISIIYKGDIVLGYFTLTDLGGPFEKNEVILEGKLTVTSVPKQVIHAKGTMAVNLSELHRISTTTDLMVLNSMNFGHSEGILDWKELYFSHSMEVGGPLEDFISFKGKGEINGREATIKANGELRIFDEGWADGALDVNLDNQTMNADAGINIIGQSLDGYFSTGQRFSNPRCGTGTDVNVLGVTAGVKFMVTAGATGVRVHALGIDLPEVWITYYQDINEDLIKEMIKRLLSPELPSLNDLMDAIKNGEISINPFSGFGPGGGSTGGDGGDGGDAGDGAVDGSGADGTGDSGLQSDAVGTENVEGGASASNLENKVNEATEKLDDPSENPQDVEVDPGEGGNAPEGESAALLNPGTFYFPIRKENGKLKVIEKNTQEPVKETHITFLEENVDGFTHFKQSNGKWKSIGTFFGVGSTHFAHAVPQNRAKGNACGSGPEAVAYWFKSSDEGDVYVTRFPLGRIKNVGCYSELKSALGNPAVKGWLSEFTRLVGAEILGPETKLNLVKSSNFFEMNSGYELAYGMRFSGDDHYYIIAANKDAVVTAAVKNLDVIKDNRTAQKALIELLGTEPAEGVLDLYEVEAGLIAEYPCNFRKERITYVLTTGASKFGSREIQSCENEIVPEPVPIPPVPPIIDPVSNEEPLFNTDGCSMDYAMSNTSEYFAQCENDGAFITKLAGKDEERTFFEQNGDGVVVLAENNQYVIAVMNTMYCLVNNENTIYWFAGKEGEPVMMSKADITSVWGDYATFKASLADPVKRAVIKSFIKDVGEQTSNGKQLKFDNVRLYEQDDIYALSIQFEGAGTFEHDYTVYIASSESMRSNKAIITNKHKNPVDMLSATTLFRKYLSRGL